MQVTVVIAVFNGAQFIEKAVRSSHHFDIVKEIVIVDDGSTDDSLNVAQSLVASYPKIKVIQHKGGVNKGAGASWNLGITKASNEWIAILGVDDIFLENRFDKEIEYNTKNSSFDGVYGAMGVHYYSEEAEKKFLRQFNTSLTTVRQKLDPKELKYALLQMYKRNQGYFSLNSLTVKKQLLIEAGLFNPKLRLHQDTDLIIKLSCLGTLVPGIIDKAISSRGVHDENRITSSASGFSSRRLMYEELAAWCEQYYPEEKIRYKLKLDTLCYQFLDEHSTYSILYAMWYSLKHIGLFYNDRYFNLLIKHSAQSDKAKNFIIRAKEKTILTCCSSKAKKHSIYVDA